MAEITKLQAFKDTLRALKPRFEPMLKEDTDKFIQIAENFVENSTQQAKLLGASSASLFAAITKAAQCRLFIDGQEASLVPFRDSVTMMTGYKGILKMVRNSGELSSINAGVAYENDVFEFYTDERGEHLTHRPLLKGVRGAPTHTYCIARTKGNPEPYIEVMTEEDVQNCKKQSGAVKAGYDTPWKGDFVDEMRKKTVIRRISKRLPMSTDLHTALSGDDEIFNAAPEEQAAQAPAPTQSNRLEQAVTAPKPATWAPTPAAAPAAPQAGYSEKQQGVMETFAQTVEGVIEGIGSKPNPKKDDPAKLNRHYFKMGGVIYATWDEKIRVKFTDLYDKKAQVCVNFVTLTTTGANPQPYNEIKDITELVAEEEVPI